MKQNNSFKLFLLLALCVSIYMDASAQFSKASFGKGLYIMAKDSSFDMKFQLRFQTLAIAEQTFNQDGLNDDFESSVLIRRARLKFSGFAFTPKLTYKIELGLSNRDIGWKKADGSEINFNGASNIILDAVLKYKIAKNTTLWFGQTKLPGNRERVISSQQLQFVDRSLLNKYFNLDRDVGLQLHHKFNLGKMIVKDIWAISEGEGRNITSGNDDGFCYTGRLEFLPFGEFTSKGDYFGSDLMREKKPKLAIGITYDYNDDAIRANGQLGNFLSQSRDLQSLHVDLMYKQKGFSLMAEYAQRSTQDPLISFDTISNKYTAFYTGNALNVQAGYLCKNNLEFAGRYTMVTPTDGIGQMDINQYTLCLSKYFVGHYLKIQSDISYFDFIGDDDKGLQFRFQVELAF